MQIKLINCVLMGGIKMATIENPLILISHNKYKYPVLIIQVVKAMRIEFYV